MARIDALYLEDPCSGSRRMVDYMAREGIPISRDRVRNLMRRKGLRAIYQKPRTTVPGEPSERYPCLVDLRLVRAVDQVWATDITYIPLQKGFLYLVAIVDLFSRHVLSWKLSNSLDTEFCLDALEMALEGGRRPEIFHSDQGCQFTSTDFVARLQAEKIKISWSGRKRCYDNILVERLRPSIMHIVHNVRMTKAPGVFPEARPILQLQPGREHSIKHPSSDSQKYKPCIESRSAAGHAF